MAPPRPLRATFPTAWFGPSLSSDGPGADTYGVFDEPGALALDVTFDGSFAWLPPMDDVARRAMEPHWKFNKVRGNLGTHFEPAVASATARGFVLPDAFLRFMRSTALQRRIPSPTACYFDAPERVVDAPTPGDGILLRFYNDQQWCMLWYLYVERGGAHAVIASPYAFDAEPIADGGGDRPDLGLYRCAPDFERFIYRTWLDGTVWFALVKKHRPLTDDERRYLARVSATSTR